MPRDHNRSKDAMSELYCLARAAEVSRSGSLRPPQAITLSLLSCLRPIAQIQFATIRDHYLFGRLTATGTDCLDRFNDVHAFNHRTEDDMLSVQARSLGRAQEELRSIRARASVRHGEDTFACVFQLEILVLKLFAID